MSERIFISEGQQRLIYYPTLFRDLSFEDISGDINWQQNEIRIFGKTHPEPRLTSWCGPSYQYSNIKWPDSPWVSKLDDLRNELNKITGFEFNAVLCNLYRNGEDSMGWHADNEKEIDQRLIASISIGESRIFKVRKKGASESQSIQLEHGSLLLMENFQEHWQHSIAKSKKLTNPRINLTFRRILVEKAT
jgi:alkylated DNA repair dioxygenase AlkB